MYSEVLLVLCVVVLWNAGSQEQVAEESQHYRPLPDHQTTSKRSTTDTVNTATLIYKNNLKNRGMVGRLHLTGSQKKATKEADSYVTFSYLTLGCWSKQTVGKRYK